MDIIETLKDKMNKFFKSRKTKKECKEINKTGPEIVNRIRKKKAWEFQQDRQRQGQASPTEYDRERINGDDTREEIDTSVKEMLILKNS